MCVSPSLYNITINNGAIAPIQFLIDKFPRLSYIDGNIIKPNKIRMDKAILMYWAMRTKLYVPKEICKIICHMIIYYDIASDILCIQSFRRRYWVLL